MLVATVLAGFAAVAVAGGLIIRASLNANRANRARRWNHAGQP